MAQTGYTPISLYYSTTASTAPTAGNLVNGELAINITDGKLYYKDNAGVVQTIAQKGGSVSSFSGGTTGLTPNTATTGVVTLAGTLAVANGGTGVTSSTGSGNVVLSTSPTLVTPILGTPTSGNLANCTFPAGTVLQVVNGTYSTSATNTTGTFADTGLSASITPKFSTSKILVNVSLNGCGKNNTADCAAQFILLRNSTQIVAIEGFSGYNNAAQFNYIGTVGCEYLDSPATTSATTYKTQFKRAGSGGTVYVGNGYNSSAETTCTITLMEIAQ
jgi:hypothetical protein